MEPLTSTCRVLSPARSSAGKKTFKQQRKCLYLRKLQHKNLLPCSDKEKVLNFSAWAELNLPADKSVRLGFCKLFGLITRAVDAWT